MMVKKYMDKQQWKIHIFFVPCENVSTVFVLLHFQTVLLRLWACLVLHPLGGCGQAVWGHDLSSTCGGEEDKEVALVAGHDK